MTEFQALSSNHQLIRGIGDWGNLLDHGLVKSASYIIRKNGGYYEAINGSTGKISYGGQYNAGSIDGGNFNAIYTACQATLLSNPGGGTICLKNGTYTGNIEISKNINFIGENQRYTKIVGTVTFDSSNLPNILNPSSIKHLTIDAKSASEDYALNIEYNVGGSLFEDLRLAGVVADVRLGGSDMYYNVFRHIVTNYGGVYGFYIDGYVDEGIFENIQVGSQDYGVFMHSTTGLMSATTWRDFGTDNLNHAALVLTRAGGNKFIHCRFGDFPSTADTNYVLLDDTSGLSVKLVGNVFDGCYLFGGNTGGNIPIYQSGKFYIGTNYDSTTLINCQGMGIIYIKSGVSRTRINNLAPYRTTFYTVDPIIIDNGVGTICTGPGFEESGVISVADNGVSSVTTSLYNAPTTVVLGVHENPSIIDSYTLSNRDDALGLTHIHPSDEVGKYSSWGQCFNIASDCLITSAKLCLYKIGSPTGSLTYKIYAMSGVYGTSGIPNGAVLATSNTLDISTISADYSFYELYFLPAYSITAGNYCIEAILDAGVVDGSNYLLVGLDTSAPTHGGNTNHYENGSWGPDAWGDLVFYVYTDNVSTLKYWWTSGNGTTFKILVSSPSVSVLSHDISYTVRYLP